MAQFNDAEDPRRRRLIQALASGALAGALPAGNALADGVLGSAPGKLPPGRSIYRLSGKVLVSGKPATLDTQVTANDIIETGPDGEIVFVIGGQAMILRGGSRLDLKGEQRETGLVVSVLRLVSGKLLSVSRNQKMNVTTPTATIGIRGTGFYLESEPDLTYFCTCYGVTDVVSASDPESRDTVAATHHDRPLYITGSGQRGANIRPAGFRNHTDQELMLIETLVGRSTPFVFPGKSYDAPRRDY